MKQHITDKAEVSVDFPDKVYYGSFGRHSTFDVRADEHGVHIDLQRDEGERRHVGFHIHYYLLGDILASLANSLSKLRDLDEPHRDTLRDAVKHLAQALDRRPRKRPRRER